MAGGGRHGGHQQGGDGVEEVLGSDVGHGEKLDHGVVAPGSNIGGVRAAGSPIGHWGDKMLMELSNTFLSKKFVINMYTNQLQLP